MKKLFEEMKKRLRELENIAELLEELGAECEDEDLKEQIEEICIRLFNIL